MQTIKLGKTLYITNRDDILSHHAKCTGKHKIVKSKGGEKRVYPPQGAQMSTADYVRAYQNMNSKIMPWDWQPLTEHVSQPQGEDTFEVEA